MKAMAYHTQSRDFDSIRTREDFAGFVTVLRGELSKNPERWENVDLESFLEALSAAAIDIKGSYKNMGLPPPNEPSWKIFAELLAMASTYE